MHYIDVYITATVNEPVLCGSTPPLSQLEPTLVDSLPSSPILSSLASPPPNEYMRELEDSALHKDALDHDLQSVHDEPIKPVYSNPESFQKIYNGSNISVCGFNCMIMKFANKHNLTYSAIDELLELLNIICPRPNEIPTSIYKLKKFSSNLKTIRVAGYFAPIAKFLKMRVDALVKYRIKVTWFLQGWKSLYKLYFLVSVIVMFNYISCMYMRL